MERCGTRGPLPRASRQRQVMVAVRVGARKSFVQLENAHVCWHEHIFVVS